MLPHQINSLINPTCFIFFFADHTHLHPYHHLLYIRIAVDRSVQLRLRILQIRR
ncbi:hypothetical protein HanIR_Chr06g0295761 [Helianthus annuus]|nr:hypothetical protein HanIR_Chr06g0295761 [Helianthus annuus]